jgi:mannose-6-phosphate isomerase-like protein (cupin superfamily)
MSENKLTSIVCNLKIPLTLSKDQKRKSFPIFKGIGAGSLEITCHVVVLAKGDNPHDPHNHDEEEILFLLSGSANLIHPDSNDSVKNGNMDLKEGQFVYYPAHFYHTLKTTSDIPANYLTLKWKTNSKNKNPGLNFSYFNTSGDKDNQKNDKFLIKPVFEGSTLYLQKLHCHTSAMNSGGGVETHRDIYDVVSIILEGEVETLGKKVTPYDVIFYAAGKPHSLYNQSNNIAREVAFEFHTKVSLIIRIPYYLNYYIHKLVELKFWKSRLKKILRL